MNKKEIIIKAIDDKLGSDIKVIDFMNTNPFYDYFIIATSLNEKMSEAISRNVVKTAIENGFEVNKVESSAEWTLIDVDDIVVHIFSPVGRVHYSLDKLWADLPVEEVNL